MQSREERLDLVLQGTNDGIWDWDIRTDEVYFSPRWKSMLGYADDEVANRKDEWNRLLHPDDLERALAAVQDYLDGRTTTYQLEHRLRHKDGTYRWILARGIALRDEAGRAYRMVGSHTDITDRKQAEQALLESETNLRSLMENARVFAVYRIAVDPSNPYLARVVVASPSMKEVFGIPDLHDFTTWFTRIHPEDLPRIVEANRRSLETGVPFDQQLRFFNAERGGWVWAHVRSTPVFDADGRLTHFNGLVVDISEQKRAQKALQAAYQTLEQRIEERTRELATLNAIAAVVSRSLDLKEVLSNALDKTMEVIQMGCGGAYCLEGEGDAAYLNPLVYRGLSEEFVRFAGRLPLKDSAIEVAAGSGQPLVWDVQSSPAESDMKQALKDEGIELVVSVPLMVKGRLVGAIQVGAPEIRAFAPEELSLLAAIGQQVGLAVENARLYEQAEQVAAAAERSRLARELHDSVTQSLYSVMLYAEAAARSIADREDTSASEYLRELRDTAQEALREMRLLIFELRPPALEKSGLVAALQARLDAVEARGGMQAELTVDGECVAERLPHVVQEELYHIAQEALNNALKHSHARCVQIRVRFQDAAIRLEVCDDGVGFSPDIAQAGGGLGLRGMQERAQRIGGILRVESARGTGTRVIVEAPMVSPNVEQIASAAGGTQ